ncbi:hypothetical protein [Treponema phagedenis]|uniref:hypothetical protein n=1 Tax=Treponema phagedenis TaxID=162 RepID=UPI0001F63972|nr:hypothetical protein [Treponema phagedenis]EFW36408.1 hypothetical protein HMPREF9554_03106 [Treponema phagedenis F0421]TYT76638.1 hypothetical protein FS559_14410 [Treponema phagedenis]
MNQDRVKEILLEIEDTDLDFFVIFSGKKSMKVNGLYKSDTHEIILHNKNFKTDNELLYTAIHEYTHHKLCELDNGAPQGKAHTQRFWACFHRLLEKAEEKQLYALMPEELPELNEITEEIRSVIMLEDGKLMKELGRLLQKARSLCSRAGIRFEDYIDRVLCLPRPAAVAIEKIHAYDLNPALGYEGMKMVAGIANPSKREAAERMLLAKQSPAMTKENLKPKQQEEDPRRKLEKEKRRLEKTIKSLAERLAIVNETLEKIGISSFIICVLFFSFYK